MADFHLLRVIVPPEKETVHVVLPEGRELYAYREGDKWKTPDGREIGEIPMFWKPIGDN